MSVSKQYITLDQIKAELKARTELIEELNKFEKVIVVTRGGLGVAAVLSQFIKTRWYDTACIMSYNDSKEQTAFKSLKVNATEDEILIIEDMVDTGQTINYLRQFFPNSRVFSLHVKPSKAITLPDFYLWETEDWIVYPWELG